MERILNRAVCQNARAIGTSAAGSSRHGTKHLRSLHSSTFLRVKTPSKATVKPRPILAYKPPSRKPPTSTQSASNPSKPKPNPFLYRSTPLFLGGLTLFGASAYATYFLIALTRPVSNPVPVTATSQPDVSARYDDIASSFDSEVDWTEWTMGITSLRKKLASKAQGDVLEVSIGTGRNLEYYDWNFKGFNGVGKVDYKGFMKKGKVRSFTAVDKSEEMLEIAHEKFGKMFPGILGVRWVVADASEKGRIPGPPKNANETSGNLDKKYDTVVQTMGLCSVNDPVALLRNLGDLVKEDEGRILLLEHGRGRWKWLNSVLDKFAEGHAKQFGCWWNRDIWEIVRESGLEVVKIETPNLLHGGTTYWIELRKPKSVSLMVDKAEVKVKDSPVPEKAAEKESQIAEKPTKKGWW